MRNFATYPVKNYIGTPFTTPSNLCAPLGKKSRAVTLEFNWATYFAMTGSAPNIGVNINLQNNNVQGSQIDRIISVYIDNLGSAIPIYVYFPDTGFTVVAPANTATWYPVVTNALVAAVYALGLSTASLPLTKLFFSDVFVPPYSDTELQQSLSLYKASPAITRGTTIYNTSFGTPALGDQTAQYIWLIATGAGINPVPILGSPKASGYFYMTGIDLGVINPSSGGGGSDRLCGIQIYSTGSAGVLVDVPFMVFSATLNVNLRNNLFSMTGQNWQIDATQNWNARFLDPIGGGLAAGWASLILSFTYQP